MLKNHAQGYRRIHEGERSREERIQIRWVFDLLGAQKFGGNEVVVTKVAAAPNHRQI